MGKNELNQFFYQILDVLGNQVLTGKVNNKQTEIDISTLTKGIYLVKIQAKNVYKTFKIVKE